MIKAVLFDFGQTLIDSSQGFREAEKQAQGIIFKDLKSNSWPEFQAYYRRLRQDFHNRSLLSRKALWEQVYNHYQREVNPEFLLKTEADYWETVKEHTRPFPEAHNVLGELSKSFQLGMITNTQGQIGSGSHRLTLFPEIEQFFSVIFVAGEGGVPAKPHKESFLLCLSKMGLTPSEAIYVGDDWRNDILSAGELGIKAVWLKHHTVERNWPKVKIAVPVITNLEMLLDMEDLKIQ